MRILLITLGLAVTLLGGMLVLRPTTFPSLSEEDSSRSIEEVIAPTTSPIKTSSITLKNLNLDNFYVTALVMEVNVFSTNKVLADLEYFNSQKIKLPILLLLDSPGGSVLDGARIISAIQASKYPVYTACLSLCASMAAMILSYGKERYAVDRSVIMFHPASVNTKVNEELDKIVSRFSFIKRYVDKMDSFVAARSGQTYEAFKAQSSRELWIDAEDALSQRYIDAVVKLQNSSQNTMEIEDHALKKELNLHN